MEPTKYQSRSGDLHRIQATGSSSSEDVQGVHARDDTGEHASTVEQAVVNSATVCRRIVMGARKSSMYRFKIGSVDRFLAFPSYAHPQVKVS